MFAPPLRWLFRATHGRSTHHRFALDALPLVQTDPGRRLTTQLLRHCSRYLTGATDPDTRFCDYQNHVIHVTDGYWGGAPRVAHRWYQRMQRYLRENRFSDAAHAAGVLSHYFTDPLQPLHTQSDQRELVQHRPIEWSIARSYNRILQRWRDDDLRIVFQLSDGPEWLGEAILHGARFANRKYNRLLDHYDITAAATQAEDGLDDDSIDCLAELFGLAITGWARVLERAAADAEAVRRKQLPTAHLLLPTLLATSAAPARLACRWSDQRRDRWEVHQLIKEFFQTGTLRQYLPAEVDIVHRVIRVHEDEKRWNAQRQRRLASTATVVDVENTDLHPATIKIPTRTDRRRAA